MSATRAIAAGTGGRTVPALHPGPQTTLLVFTLGARAEGRRKRLLPTRLRDRETALYRACLEEALAAGRGADCRLQVCSPGGIDLPADAVAVGQDGDGFGERFAHAFDTALSRTRGPVVTVGTDTPGLREEHVERALALLAGDDAGGDPAASAGESGRVVLGPSPDGGFYLLASSRPLGDVLRRVRWCRTTTLNHLRRLLHQAGFAVTLLEPLADLDRRRDLERWLAGGAAGTNGRSSAAAARPTGRCAAVIARALAALRRPSTACSVERPAAAPTLVRRGRAPPLTLSA